MSKAEILQGLIDRLEASHAVMEAAVEDSKENATGAETKSEGKYDTRAVEASYLAGAQAEQAARSAEALHLLKTFDPPAYQEGDAIGPGALVEAEQNGEIAYYFLAPAGGGMTTEHDGFDLTVISPESRLYQTLLARRSGEIDEATGLCVLSVE